MRNCLWWLEASSFDSSQWIGVHASGASSVFLPFDERGFAILQNFEFFNFLRRNCFQRYVLVDGEFFVLEMKVFELLRSEFFHGLRNVESLVGGKPDRSKGFLMDLSY